VADLRAQGGFSSPMMQELQKLQPYQPFRQITCRCTLRG
jgi:hypothetical protein